MTHGPADKFSYLTEKGLNSTLNLPSRVHLQSALNSDISCGIFRTQLVGQGQNNNREQAKN